jgi:hypothetical protein
MKRMIPLLVVLAVAVTVLAEQALSPATQSATAPVTTTAPAIENAAAGAAPATAAATSGRSSTSRYASTHNSSDSYRSRYDSSGRSRKYEASTTRSSGSVQAMLIPAPRALGSEYSILAQRSMFVKGMFRYTGEKERTHREYAGPTTTISDPLENNLVFNAVVKDDTGIAAFVENYLTTQIRELHKGDAIANGKIGDVTLNYLDYVTAGKTTRVAMGRTLFNGDPPATRPFAAGSTAAADSGSSSSSGGSSSIGTLAPPTDALIEKLKKRREAENVGK